MNNGVYVRWEGDVKGVSGRPTLALGSALVPETLSCSFCVEHSELISLIS